METPERHRGGRTDSRRGAANLPFSTPPRGTGTSPRSSRSATLIPSPSILEIAIPGHLVIRFLCKNKADVGAAAMDDTTAIHFDPSTRSSRDN
ncbi:Ankyrin repeat [Musa troglodytarum]|uniref:Ankyrin repeat n=1 Tax=Musa troglodytarum TaxID=320322 RepID=A0A9E7ELB0_9LILI|nr:Ankyrin repeat [Musa troglodytarum]